MKILVQKFGGTSLATRERINAAAEIIRDAIRRGYSVVAVASAMGHTTDELLSMTNGLDTQHALRELDMLLSVGEQISTSLLAMQLITLGMPAIALTGAQAGIVTDTMHGSAGVVEVSPAAVIGALRQGKVAVVTGYQGVNHRGDVTTLGRGGSDTTAIALAYAVRAERCDIYSDVDGLYTADPSVVHDARKIMEIPHAQLRALSEAGTQVMCLTSVELAERWDVDFRIRSAFKPGDPGTLVTSKRASLTVAGTAFESPQELYWIGPADTLAELQNVAELIDRLDERGIKAEVMRRFGKRPPSAVPVAIGCRHVHDTQKTLQMLCAQLGLQAVFRQKMAKVSLVGNIGNADKTLQRAASALLQQRVRPLYCMTENANDKRLSILVHPAKAVDATCALHREFVTADRLSGAVAGGTASLLA